jgi:hypothetical protein
LTWRSGESNAESSVVDVMTSGSSSNVMTTDVIACGSTSWRAVAPLGTAKW